MDVNQWFLSLPPEHQAVLCDDKWLLANAAVQAATKIEREARTKAIERDIAFLMEVRDHFVRGRAGDPAQLDCVEQLLSDWLNQLAAQPGARQPSLAAANSPGGVA